VSSHPAVVAAAAKAEPKLAKVVEKVASAAPSTVSALLSFFRTVILPILTPMLASLIVKYGSGKLRAALEPVRDLLNSAYPAEPDE